MADYSFVKDASGQVVGLWLRDTEKSKNRIVILTLLMQHKGRLAELRKPISDDLVNMASSGNYRVVPNNFDHQGGCFVMFGQALAPGEKE